MDAAGRSQRGDVLVDVGDKVIHFFVVVSGEIHVVQPSPGTQTLIGILRPGQFSGEGTMITGRRALARLRVNEPGEVVELDREHLLALVQTDAELSEILMRAFILRRVEFIARGLGDVVLDWFGALFRHAESQGIPDPQRASLRLHRPRSRQRRAGAARSISRNGGGCAGVDLPRR